MPSNRHAPSEPSAAPVIPLAAERLTIGRRRIDTARVIITTKTDHVPVVIDEVIQRDDVRIERVPVDRFIDKPAAPRYEGDVLVIPVMEEVIVVTRRLRLIEEVRIDPKVVTGRHRETVPVRRQRIEVERRPVKSQSNPNTTRRKP
jgi:stress response protein YsnF